MVHGLSMVYEWCMRCRSVHAWLMKFMRCPRCMRCMTCMRCMIVYDVSMVYEVYIVYEYTIMYEVYEVSIGL